MGILDGVRSGLPEISALTFADKFLLAYICTSLLPLIKDDQYPKMYMWAMHIHEGIMVMSTVILFWKYFWSLRNLNQMVPVQKKESGAKAAADKSWGSPTECI